jgi:type III secretion protein S
VAARAVVAAVLMARLSAVLVAHLLAALVARLPAVPAAMASLGVPFKPRPARAARAAEVPSGSALAALGQESLLLAVADSVPVVAIAAPVGLQVAVLQAATQVQDATLGHLPRLLVVAVVLALMAPWMVSDIAAFALRAFHGG